jgi:hypothetical protein
MEAASRPPLEALPDLPVEEPLNSPKARPAASAAPAAVPAGAEASKSKDPEQTGLNFVDPEMFLAPGQAASAIPVVNASEQSAKAPEPPPELELLEDPVVDDLLTAPPPPPPPPAPVTPAPAAAALKPAATESPAEVAAVRAAARVPIAKTASLSAAATKLAAASGVARPTAKPAPTPKPVAAPKPAATPGSSGEASAKPAATAPKPTAAATAAKPEATAPKLDAPSLASWASAREAAAHKVRPATPSSGAERAPVAAAARAAASRPAAVPTAATTYTAPATPAPPAAAANTVPASPPMDRDFIARNQVVERYLSGRLPLKAATEFERFCRDHPEMLDQVGLPERVNAGLRLLEAAGKPEPWQEAARPAWQKPQVTVALAVAVVVLAMTLAGLGASNSSRGHRIADLEKQNTERALDPATSTREIRLLPSRSGASNSPAIVIGGGGNAQLADFKIDESRSPYHAFRVTIDRIDQGRVAVINNLDKDSNGHLRIALNSSALGPGNYQLTLEGLDWRGQPQPDSWVTIGLLH